MSACSANAFAVRIIWMRQVLPTKPLTSAMRYGPGRCGHWKKRLLLAAGAKHCGIAPGPCTTRGVSCADVVLTNAPMATAQPNAAGINLLIGVSPRVYCPGRPPGPTLPALGVPLFARLFAPHGFGRIIR
jgi:hypothetical protein